MNANYETKSYKEGGYCIAVMCNKGHHRGLSALVYLHKQSRSFFLD